MPLLEAVLAGILTDTVHATGTWLARAVAARRGRPGERDLAIAQWFDTYELVVGLAALPALPPGISEDAVAAWLRSHETQAVFQELIVVRLTDAPPSDLDRVRENLRFTCLDTFPELPSLLATDLSNAIFDAADIQLQEMVRRIIVQKAIPQVSNPLAVGPTLHIEDDNP